MSELEELAITDPALIVAVGSFISHAENRNSDNPFLMGLLANPELAGWLERFKESPFAVMPQDNPFYKGE